MNMIFNIHSYFTMKDANKSADRSGFLGDNTGYTARQRTPGRTTGHEGSLIEQQAPKGRMELSGQKVSAGDTGQTELPLPNGSFAEREFAKITGTNTVNTGQIVTDTFMPATQVGQSGYGNGANPMDAMLPKDSAAISADWESQVNWFAETQKVISNLQKSFPGIQILYSGSQLNQKDLANLAASLGKGSHLILSEDFLKQMTSGSEGFEKGKAALTDALSALASKQGNPAAPGKGTYLQAEQKMSWTLNEPQKQEETPKPKWQQDAEQAQSMLEQMKKAQEEAKERKNKFRVKTSSSSYQTATSYAKLASAGSKSSVRGVMGEARRNISSLKMAAAFGDSDERTKARAAIRSYETLLMRGNRKIRRLNEEELVRLRKKRAEQREQKEKALALKMEMNRQKTKRRSADRMLVEEGKLYDRNGMFYTSHKHNKYDPREEYDQLSASYIPAMPTTGGVPAGDMGTAGAGIGAGGFTAADVTITIE